MVVLPSRPKHDLVALIVVVVIGVTAATCIDVGAQPGADSTCVEIPDTTVIVTCDSIGTLTLTFDLKNLFSTSIYHIYLLGAPSGVAFIPNHFSLVNSPLPPGGTVGPLVTTITGVDLDSTVCFLVSVHDSLVEQCCSVELCVSCPIPTGVRPIGEIGRAVLRQNHPNPFNPTTMIEFVLPRYGHVALRIFDVRGRRVRTLLDTRLGADTHAVLWDGRNDNGDQVRSGVYFYQLRFTGGFNQTRKMMLIQ